MYSIVYFSPTGNVFHLAKRLAANLGSDESEIMPLEYVESSHLKKNTHLILLYPVHGFNAPRPVQHFIKNLPPNLYKFVNLIGVGCTTNWLNAAASSVLRKRLNKKGYSLIVDEILAMPLTFIMSFPDKVSHKLIDESEAKIMDIGMAITKNEQSNNKVKTKSYIISFIGKIEHYAAILFGLELHANKKCTSCEICWNNCPTKNITKNSKGKPRFGFNCLMCMRCIYNCPDKSISPRFSKFIPIKKGYSFKNFNRPV